MSKPSTNFEMIAVPHKYVANIRLKFLSKLSLKPSFWNFRTWSCNKWTAETSLPEHAFPSSNIVGEWVKSKPCILICLSGSFVVDNGDHLTVEDHFRSILGTICGRGSFMVLYNCKFNSGKIRPLLKESPKERRFDIIVVVAQSLTNVAGSSFEFDHSSLSFWSVNNSLLATIQFVSFQPFLSTDRHVTALEMRSTR